MPRGGPTVVIDARMIAASGIGTYLRNTLSRIVAARPNWRFVLIGDRRRLSEGALEPALNVEIVSLGAPVYSLREQLAFVRPGLRRADLFWSPHYNIPLAPTPRLVVTVHDVMHLTRPEYRRHWLRRCYAASMYRAVRHRASAVICVSNFTRSELEGMIGARLPTHVIHNGVDPAWFDLRPPRAAASRPYVVFVGIAKPHKNIVGLLEAFAMIQDRVPHDLVIVGANGPSLRTADRRVESAAAPLRDRVRFAGHLELSALQECVAGADVLVQPSFYEGFGLPPLEAMAAGTPCLVSRIEPLIEVCGDAAVYCDPCDSADIATRLLALLQASDERDRLRREGRARARAFTWDRTASETLAIFDRVLAS